MAAFTTGSRVYVPARQQHGVVAARTIFGLGGKAPVSYTIRMDTGDLHSCMGTGLEASIAPLPERCEPCDVEPVA